MLARGCIIGKNVHGGHMPSNNWTELGFYAHTFNTWERLGRLPPETVCIGADGQWLLTVKSGSLVLGIFPTEVAANEARSSLISMTYLELI